MTTRQCEVYPIAMRRFRLRTALLCASWVAWSASGCASKPPKPVPAVATLSIVARPDANPDASGRPSPIVLRLYQLKADAAFVDSDFFPLFDDDKRALGADLVSREEMELAPGEARALEVPFAPETRFIAVLGAYRDVGNARWRAIAPAPGSKGKRIHVETVAERARVTVSVTP